MKNLILAIAISLGALSVTAPAVDAATVTITENGVRFSDRDHRDHRRTWHRRHDGWRDQHRYGNRYHSRHYGFQRRHDECRTRTVKRYDHHRVVYRTVTVCNR